MPVASPPATRPPTLPATRQTDASRRAKDTSWTSGFARVAPGLGLALAAAVLSVGVSARIPAVSALLLAIVLGIVVGNAGILPASTAPGLAVASRRLLRVGIVLLGLYVAPAQITALGGGVIAVAVAVVAGGFLVAEIAGRLLGVAPSQRILIGAGMSICGAAAVAAVEPVAREQAAVGSARQGAQDPQEVDAQVVTAVALVVALGTLMIGLVPAVSSLLGLGERTAGLWAGASIHEVAQVVATGGILGGVALQAAVVVKLTRVLLLAPVVALLGLRARRAARAHGGGMPGVRRPPLVPLFVVGFLAAVALRGVGIVPEGALEVLATAQTLLFAAAMFALGCGVRLATMRAVGGRPVALAALTTTVVACIGLGGVLLLPA